MPAASGRPSCTSSATIAYTRCRPEEAILYAVVRDNLETLYGAVNDGALGVALPAFVRAELERYLEWGEGVRRNPCHRFQLIAETSNRVGGSCARVPTRRSRGLQSGTGA